MASLGVTRIPSAWVGAIFSLLAAGLLVPGTARAGCTHPHVAVKSVEMTGDLSLLRGFGSVAPSSSVEADAPVPASPKEYPGRCHGPSCSKREGVPPPSPSVVDVRAVQWAVLAILPGSDDPNILSSSGDNDSVRPVHEPRAIFHPPRPHFAIAD